MDDLIYRNNAIAEENIDRNPAKENRVGTGGL